MKKVSTAGAGQTNNFREQKLTIGLDQGDRWSWYCVPDEGGQSAVGTTTEHNCESDLMEGDYTF